MTRKEMFVTIVDLATVAGRDDIISFATQEIETIEAAESKIEAAKVAKAAERSQLIADILNTMPRGVGVRAKEIAEELKISTQKAVYYLNQLAQEGKVFKDKYKNVTTFELR